MPARGRWIALITVAIVVVILLLLLGRQLSGYVVSFARVIEDLSAWGPIAFMAAYALATIAFVPGSILSLTAGALFGLTGALYVLVGAVLGSSAAFLIARHVARDAVERRLANHARFAAVDRAIGREGRKIAILLRLSPVVPYNVLNYTLGLTPVRFLDYTIASVGMLPGIILYVYTGWVIGDVAALAAGAANDRSVAHYVVLATGLVATLWVTWYITRLARRALDQVQ
jgi:uncharacterized membrane protein YdjX (TVP38/TMEM64 family)